MVSVVMRRGGKHLPSASGSRAISAQGDNYPHVIVQY